jgi:hypothetical protein
MENARVPRAVFSWTVHGNVMAIKDEFRARFPTRTVTNDADDVVADLVRQGDLLPGMRVVYCDSEGVWDELLVKDGRFDGFAPIRAATIEAALAAIAGGQADEQR